MYRLGFGDQAALETIRAASAKSLFDLREQAGVRIGVVISDDTTMVYSPVSKNIEAGSTSMEKPNAIMLSGAPQTALPRPPVQTRATRYAPEVGTGPLSRPKCSRADGPEDKPTKAV